MRVAERHVDGRVAEDLLKCDDVASLGNIVAGKRMPEIVHPQLSNPRPFCSLSHLRPEIDGPHPSAPVRENELSVPLLPELFQGFQQPGVDGNVAHLPAFCRPIAAPFDPDHPLFQINVFPLQRDDFANSHSGIDRAASNRPKVGRAFPEQKPDLVLLVEIEALLRLLELVDEAHGRKSEEAPSHRVVEHLPQDSEGPVDGRRFDEIEFALLVLIDHPRRDVRDVLLAEKRHEMLADALLVLGVLRRSIVDFRVILQPVVRQRLKAHFSPRRKVELGIDGVRFSLPERFKRLSLGFANHSPVSSPPESVIDIPLAITPKKGTHLLSDERIIVFYYIRRIRLNPFPELVGGKAKEAAPDLDVRNPLEVDPLVEALLFNFEDRANLFRRQEILKLASFRFHFILFRLIICSDMMMRLSPIFPFFNPEHFFPFSR